MKVTFTFVSSKPVNPKREEIICQTKKKTHLCQVRSDKEMLGIYKNVPIKENQSSFWMDREKDAQLYWDIWEIKEWFGVEGNDSVSIILSVNWFDR